MRLALAVLRGDARGRVSALLVACGVAIGVSLVLWLVSAPYALQGRADRAGWRSPDAAVSESFSRLMMAVNRDSYRGLVISRFDVAGSVDVPVAPGIPRVPGPGEVLLSPALASLVAQEPRDSLGDRFPGKVIGELGPAALQYPDELVAIVGHSPGAVRGFPLASLTGVGGSVDELLLLLTRVGLVVLVVPCLVLVSSAARLTAARRERRVVAFRLAGATPWQTVVVTVAETAVGAVAGSAVGVVVAGPLSSVTARIPWGGGTWFPGDFTPPTAVVVVVAVLAPLLTVGAAVLGLLRGTRLSVVPGRIKAGDPLGGDASVSKGRLWLVVGACLVFLLGVELASGQGGGDRFTVVVAGVGAVSLALVFAGPVVTALVGRFFVSRWCGPATLLAGRRLAGDPVAAFRGSAGLVVAVFTGSMALTMLPGLAGQVPHSDETWRDEAIVATNVADPRQVETLQAVAITEGQVNEVGHSAIVARCADLAPVLNGLSCAPGPAIYTPAGMPPITGDFQPSRSNDKLTIKAGAENRTYVARGRGYVVIDPELLPPLRPTGVVALADAANRDAVHTAVVRALPGAWLGSNQEQDVWGDTVMEDLRRATVIGLAIAAGIGGAAAAVAAAGSVIDRRRTFAALVAAGTPVRTLGRALRREVMLPVFAATVGACGAGLVVGLGLLGITRGITERGGFVMSPWFIVPVGAGLLVALVAAAACGPVLRGIRPGDYASE